MELISKLGIDWKLLVAQIVNFFILLFVLYKFAYKPVLEMLEKRSKTIEKGIHDAKASEERLKEIVQRFAKDIRPKMKTDRFARFEKVEINNAYLASLNTYVYDLSDFSKLYDHVHGNFAEFLNFCKSLEGEKNPAQKLKEFLRQP
mgnify:CR=1 FL=1